MKSSQTNILKITYSLSIIFLLAIVACQPPCNNEVGVFDELPCEDPEYQKALKSILSQAEEHELRFYVRDYLFVQEEEYLVVKVHGPKVCAEAHFLVNNPSGIKGIRNHQAKGYRGAELRGLAYSVSSEVENGMIYQGVDRIVD